MSLLFTVLLILSNIKDLALPTADVLARYETLAPGSEERSVLEAQLVQAYSSACGDILKKPEFINLPIEDIIKTYETQKVEAPVKHKIELDDEAGPAGVSKPVAKPGEEVLPKIDVESVIQFYHKICPDVVNTPPKRSISPTALDDYDIQIQDALAIFASLQKNLPDLKNLAAQTHLSQTTELLSADGAVIAEIYKSEGRRKWVNIDDLPAFIPKTFWILEDRRFFDHHGVDPIGLLRAFSKSFTSDKRPEGGSTITQQVAKNLYLDHSLSMTRKLREMLIAETIDSSLTKKQILEIYINQVYFGRNSWGIEEAAETYFGKPAAKLTVYEVDFLAGIVQAPGTYQYKDQHLETRVNNVLQRSFEEGITPKLLKVDLNKDLRFVDGPNLPESDFFRDYIYEKMGGSKNPQLSDGGLQIKTTLNPKLQKLTQDSLREGFIDYERKNDRYEWRGPVTNISNDLDRQQEKIEANQKVIDERKQDQAIADASDPLALATGHSAASIDPSGGLAAEANSAEVSTQGPFWLRSLRQARAKFPVPVEDWYAAVVLDLRGKAGLSDGSEILLTAESRIWAKSLAYGDVVYVRKAPNKKYEIIQVPEVNGAALAMDPQTGEILAMVGGFSYRISSYNRAVVAQRQPGSLMKPFTYMVALNKGLQPNLLLSNKKVERGEFPPTSPGGEPWIPHNDDRLPDGPFPMRYNLEKSVNIPTARLMAMVGMDPIRNLAQEFGIYDNPITDYPFILGAQETDLMRLVTAYGAIANGGLLMTPQYLSGQPTATGKKITGADGIAIFQTLSLLQGVVTRGTGAALKSLAPYIAGKTGTTESNRDAWFIGFTPHLVVGVFVGYEHPTQRTLGDKNDGARVALPIVGQILKASFESYKPKEEFPPPPAGVVPFPTDRFTGEGTTPDDPNGVLEYYRASSFNSLKKDP